MMQLNGKLATLDFEIKTKLDSLKIHKIQYTSKIKQLNDLLKTKLSGPEKAAIRIKISDSRKTAKLLIASNKKMVMKEELSLSFLDDFDAVIHALPPFISERRKRELIGLKRNAMRSHTSEYTDEFKTNMEDLARKLIELNYMMENCNRHDQGAFDECKLVAEDVGIVTKILSTPSVLINRVNEEYDKLIQLSRPPLKQPKQSNKQLTPQPQLSEEEWMDRLFVNPQSSSPPVRNQFDDLLPAGGRRTKRKRRKQSRRKLMQSKRMRSKRMRSSS